MMKKIAEIHPYRGGKMIVCYDNKTNTNPYRVYLVWYSPSPLGLREHKKLVNRYADLYSCALLMADHAREHNEEGR